MIIEQSNKTKLKWKVPKKFKDTYSYSTVQVQESEGNLHFKFTPSMCCKVRKPLYMTIADYTKYTALDIINALDDIGFNTRHSYDAVMQFYHDKGLDLGFATKILKDFR